MSYKASCTRDGVDAEMKLTKIGDLERLRVRYLLFFHRLSSKGSHRFPTSSYHPLHRWNRRKRSRGPSRSTLTYVHSTFHSYSTLRIDPVPALSRPSRRAPRPNGSLKS